MSVNPKYYYNLSGNITDGKKEYSLHHKVDKIGGLSISSGLKENHIEYGTNSLLDLLNELSEEKEICENEIARLELIVNKLKDKEYENYKKKIQELTEENKELKQLIDLFAQDICNLTETLSKNQLDYNLHYDVENFIIKWGVRIE